MKRLRRKAMRMRKTSFNEIDKELGLFNLLLKRG